MKIQTFLFSNARNKTNDNFSVVGDVFYNPCFFSAQHFDTRPSNKGDEDINATHRGKQPYTADREVFKFNIILLDNRDILVKIQGGR